MAIGPFRLEPLFRERIWGVTQLQPWFPNPESRIGEVWFTCNDNPTSLGMTLGELVRQHGEDLLGHHCHGNVAECCPILVKFLFTSERLSVQVHPDDTYARQHENSAGKTEMWHILGAEPDATVALGFREELTAERAREAARTGEIEELLAWIPVSAGDTVFTPAGTVHAIGAGLAVCEVQQNSDVTYRLFDYGRPRELHLERGMEVSHLGRYEDGGATMVRADGRCTLATCEYFTTQRHSLTEPQRFVSSGSHYHLLICTAGQGLLADQPFTAGQVWMVPASAPAFDVRPQGECQFLLSYSAAQPTECWQTGTAH